MVDVPGIGPLAWYANRDSLSYIDTYHLHGIHTFLRTTLRYPAFCRGWNKVVHLDLTNKNDHEEIKHCKTFADWFEVKRKKINAENENFTMRMIFLILNFCNKLILSRLRSNEKLPEPSSQFGFIATISVGKESCHETS